MVLYAENGPMECKLERCTQLQPRQSVPKTDRFILEASYQVAPKTGHQ